MTPQSARQEICTCCGKRPIAGYVGCGMRIDKLCIICWRKGGDAEERYNKRNGHGKEGRS